MAASNVNVIIGIDTVNARVRMMTVQGNNYQKANVDYFDFDRKLMDKGDYVSILESVFSSYDMTRLATSAISLVLPNNLVGIDFVGIPTMSKNRMTDAVRIEFNALYKNNEALQMLPVPITSTKKNALYMLIIVNRAMLNGMAQIFTSKKIPVRVKTFEANALANAVLQLRPKARRASFIFVDIKEDSTSFVVVNKERTVGYQNLPYGYNILSRTEVNNEQLLIDHDVAELAVLNATELAKKKKLTVDAAEAEELEEENAKKAEEEARKAEEEANQKTEDENREKTPEELEAEARAEAQKEADAEFADYNDEQPQQTEEVKKPAVKVFTKKLPKALPMFMQRPTPETEEGFILENFRIFEKRILLLKRHCDYDSIMPNPEFIMINMPREFEFVIEHLNNDEDNHATFIYFSPDEGAEVAEENLDLVGALFAGTWNKTHNFI